MSTDDLSTQRPGCSTSTATATSPHAPSRWRRRIATLAGAACLPLVAALSAGALPLASSDSDQRADLGCGSAQVTHILDTGSAWRMCARIDDIKGLVLEHLQFRPATGKREYPGWMPVADSLYLAQLNVPYDTGTIGFNDLTDYGFGGSSLLPQTPDTCTGTTRTVQQAVMIGTEYSDRSIPGICLTEVGTGLSWHSREVSTREDAARYAQQGRALEVSSITKISWYEYQQKVTLTDQGEITMGLGATGDLAPGIFIDDPAVTAQVGPEHEHDEDPAAGQAGSHWHNAVYRVDFGIGQGNQQVQQWDYNAPDPQLPTRVEGTGTIRTQAFNADHDPDPQTWWRVLNPTSLNPDGHARSYEIVNDAIQSPYDALTRPKMSFTNNHPCQEYASDNLNPSCPGLSVPDYVASETEALSDPVAWVNVGFHHIARDEDQSPMPSHWQEFSLVPRNLLAQQATNPLERSCINGGPVSLYGSCAALNRVRPQVTANTTIIQVGTVLTGTTGEWKEARAPLAFQRLWLRDGHPITGVSPGGLPTSATGSKYVVTAADVKSRLSLQVTAAADGVVPGTAVSHPVLVPPAATAGASPTSVASGPPSLNPMPSPTATPSAKSPVRLRATRSGARLRVLKVRVVSGHGSVRGTVTFRAKGWHRSRPVRGNKAQIRLPRAWHNRTVKVTVRYLGDTAHRRATVVVRIPRNRAR